jgi:PAS domain S-box
MTWLAVTSTTLTITFTVANLMTERAWDVFALQTFDIAGSAIFVVLFLLGMRHRLPTWMRWPLSPAYFAFWLALMTGYYFQTLPRYGENMAFAVGIVTPSILILLPPRWMLSLLLPCFAVFVGIQVGIPSVNVDRPVEAIFGSVMTGSLAVLVGALASWFLYSARRTNFEKERKLADQATELGRAESNMRAILENIPFQAWLKDVDSRFVAVNRSFAEAHGLPLESIVGKTLEDIYPESRASLYRSEDLAIMQSRERIHLEQSAELENGETVWFEVFKSPVVDEHGKCIGTSGIARDVTERRRMEDQLLAANRAKSEFLAAMSHEIRTPMNSVLGYAQLLHDLPLDETQREYVESILGSGRILLGVINDILDFSKIDAGQLTLTPTTFSLRPLLDRSVRMFEPEAAAKGLELRQEIDASVPVQCCADAVRIEQILVNLLSNAVKFTERGSVILRANSEAPGVIRFDIVDTGIGIAPDQLQRLFRPFSQADTSIARRFSGTGLGLVISQRLCELMGGRIAVETEPGKGSCFSAIIQVEPVEAEATPPSNETPPPPPDLSDLRVLVVEDNAANRRLVSVILQRWKIHAALAEGGEQALEMWKNSVFDAVLMDVQMPGMDGLETSRRMRDIEAADSRRPRARIIALTGLAMAGDQERCTSAGMDDYLTKPIHPPSLEAALLRARR